MEALNKYSLKIEKELLELRKAIDLFGRRKIKKSVDLNKPYEKNSDAHIIVEHTPVYTPSDNTRLEAFGRRKIKKSVDLNKPYEKNSDAPKRDGIIPVDIPQDDPPLVAMLKQQQEFFKYVKKHIVTATCLSIFVAYASIPKISYAIIQALEKLPTEHSQTKEFFSHVIELWDKSFLWLLKLI